MADPTDRAWQGPPMHQPFTAQELEAMARVMLKETDPAYPDAPVPTREEKEWVISTMLNRHWTGKSPEFRVSSHAAGSKNGSMVDQYGILRHSQYNATPKGKGPLDLEYPASKVARAMHFVRDYINRVSASGVDPTGGAMFYKNPEGSTPEGKRGYWAGEGEKILPGSVHKFFRAQGEVTGQGKPVAGLTDSDLRGSHAGRRTIPEEEMNDYILRITPPSADSPQIVEGLLAEVIRNTRPKARPAGYGTVSDSGILGEFAPLRSQLRPMPSPPRPDR